MKLTKNMTTKLIKYVAKVEIKYNRKFRRPGGLFYFECTVTVICKSSIWY